LFNGFIEAGMLQMNLKFTAFLKFNATGWFGLAVGFSRLFGCGLLLSQDAVPHAEKFRVGGVSKAHGIDQEKFSQCIQVASR
jgi:hypothetical protein